MKRLLQRLIQAIAYLAAALVILLAIAVGLFRLLLPRLPEYQEEIKAWANAAIGLQVEFAEMNALWRFSGPELSFLGAELRSEDTAEQLLIAEEVNIGVSLVRLLRDRQFVVDRVVIRNSQVDVRRDESGAWRVQGMPVERLMGSVGESDSVTPGQVGRVLVLGEDIRFDYFHPGSPAPLTVTADTLEIRRDAVQTAIEARLRLPSNLGNRMQVSASQRLLETADDVWQVYLEGDALDLTGWSRLQPAELPRMASGRADLNLWLELSAAGVRSTTANFSVSDFRTVGTSTIETLDADGRIEFSRYPGGWLLAANQFRLSTVAENRPVASWQIQVARDANGTLSGLTALASYVNLDDLRYADPWLPEDQRQRLAQIAPTGALLDTSIALADLETNSPRYNISAEFLDAGIAPFDTWPGVRGFSGRIRADAAGGRLEIDSQALRLNLVAQLDEAIELDDAMGTVIWRRNEQGTTVLSDSVRIRNPDLDSESSLQISLPADGSSPIVDLDSTWSVNDVSAIERYLPVKLMHPALHQWLTNALVSGSIPRGSARLAGPLEKFPFDDGEGTFRVEARLQNTVLRYAEQWPDVANMDLDVVLDGMRLFSVRNAAISSGNSVRDAQIEIADLREPVLSIDAFATGSLQSILAFSRASPIASVFGGQLDRVTVDGEASFNLLLTYPIKDRLNYEFTTRVRSSDGTIRLQGFAPPIQEIDGEVILTRESVSSEALTGVFLGQPVELTLTRSADLSSPFGVILNASGRATAEGLIDELGAPLSGIVFGATDFAATAKFPNAGAETALPFQIEVESNLEGMEIGLPVPMEKLAEYVAPFSATISFPSPDRIESQGRLAEEIRWDLAFMKQDASWDVDRGTISLGGEGAAPPDIRGLHITGRAPEVRLNDWLELAARRQTGAPGFRLGDRIRLIDLQIDNLHAVGQHLASHRVVVNRGAEEWIVQLEGADASGTVTVPYESGGGRPLEIEMDRLTLPGTDAVLSDEAPDVPTDPRRLPPITLSAAEFALGKRSLGRLSADFRHTANGLESVNLTTEDETFSFSGAAGWVIDAGDEMGQRSYVRGSLLSSDVETTMARLDYEPGILGSDMEIDLDLSFSGGPREDFMETLDGSVAVRFGAGQLNDVEPGPGRVFGLMSIVALPRRLSLDFRDVLDKGFGFDSISGTFRLVNGDAFTCDLSLAGPAADVGIVGRAGLAHRDYRQTAIVSANVGNTLPIVGAVVAGPQVAAALLIFSQIFKKPLQEVGQFYYGIDGPWDEPEIELATAIRFAQDSGAAGCIEDSE